MYCGRDMFLLIPDIRISTFILAVAVVFHLELFLYVIVEIHWIFDLIIILLAFIRGPLVSFKEEFSIGSSSEVVRQNP